MPFPEHDLCLHVLVFCNMDESYSKRNIFPFLTFKLSVLTKAINYASGQKQWVIDFFCYFDYSTIITMHIFYIVIFHCAAKYPSLYKLPKIYKFSVVVTAAYP